MLFNIVEKYNVITFNFMFWVYKLISILNSLVITFLSFILVRINPTLLISYRSHSTILSMNLTSYIAHSSLNADFKSLLLEFDCLEI
jgi:hypothetical protein